MPWACESIRLSSACDVLGLLPDVGQHLRGQRRQFGRAQTLQIFGFELLRIEHVRIVQGRHRCGHRCMFGLPRGRLCARHLNKYNNVLKML